MRYTAKDLLDHLNMLTPAQQQLIVDPSTDPLIKTLIFRIDLLLKDVEANKVTDGKFVMGFKAFNNDLTCRGMVRSLFENRPLTIKTNCNIRQ